jgi:23S rRNA (uridine2552-2'-O)-methyltransferase
MPSLVRSLSSARWLARQRKDEYVARAAKDGYRSRAAYKLIQLDAKSRQPLLQKGGVALELGSAPGSWSQVMTKQGMRVVAVDMLPMEPLEGVHFELGDFTDASVQARLLEAIDGRVDLVASDMSPNRSGHKSLDEARASGLVEQALALSRRALRRGGSLVAKLLQGADAHELTRKMSGAFGNVQLVRPKACRRESAEIFVVARGYFGEEKPGIGDIL